MSLMMGVLSPWLTNATAAQILSPLLWAAALLMSGETAKKRLR